MFVRAAPRAWVAREAIWRWLVVTILPYLLVWRASVFFVPFHSCEGIGHPCAPGVAGVAMKHRLQHSQKASNFARHEWLMETHVPLVVDGIWC